MSFDISDTLAPNSDQLDAVDLVSGSRVFTVTEVSKGSAEQPVKVKLAEFDRPWMPGKSMRRVLAACWGVDAATWAGNRVELYCDPNVRFGGAAVGGVRIKALTGIDKRKGVPLIVSRGKSAVYTVEPLREQAPKPQPARQAASSKSEMFQALADAGLADKADALGFITGVVGRGITSSSELTEMDCNDVIDALSHAGADQ